MDWLRRNWPDLLIGLALIAVIAGIVATLLTGGSFFPLGGSTVQPQSPEPSVSAPAPDVDPPVVGDESTPESDGPEVAVLPPSGSSDETTPPGAPSTDVGEEGGGQAAASEAAPSEAAPSGVTPLAPDEAAPDAQPPDVDASDSTADASASDTASSDAAAAPSDPTSTPQAAGAATGSLPTEPYRVAVGAFGQRANAETQAERFRAAGYPVFLASQDDLTLVLVGPYDEEAEAERVAAEIRSGDYDVDPVIYLFEEDDGGSVGVPDGAPAAASDDGAATPASTTPAAQGGGTRLQVGAYADPAAAEPQIERLEALGFDVRSIDENGLVKLLVGPFTGDALDDARVILDGAGIEYFSR